MAFPQLLLGIFYALVFPGFLFTAILGLFLVWVDRKVTAMVQSRVGPPWFQGYADIGKLLAKRMLVPRGSRAVGFLAAPLLALAGATLASVIVMRTLLNPTGGFVGDLVVLIYLSALPAIALVIGGASSRSPFGAIGSGRELSMILSYELGFLLAILAVLVKSHSLLLSEINAHQLEHGPIIGNLSGLIAFIVALFAMQAKLGFLPFDIPEADTELIGGPLAEYSGSGLSLFKLSQAMGLVYLPAWMALIFLGGVEPTALSMVFFLLKFVAILVLIILVKITHARLRLDQALRLFWGKVGVAAAIAVILALVGL